MTGGGSHFWGCFQIKYFKIPLSCVPWVTTPLRCHFSNTPSLLTLDERADVCPPPIPHPHGRVPMLAPHGSLPTQPAGHSHVLTMSPLARSQARPGWGRGWRLFSRIPYKDKNSKCVWVVGEAKGRETPCLFPSALSVVNILCPKH